MTQTFPDSRQIQFTYDANGNIASITPPGKSATTFTSDLADLLGLETAPTAGARSMITRYAYNLDKQVTQITRPDGRLINYSYDTTNGKLSGVTAENVQQTLTYGPFGNVSSITNTPLDHPEEEVKLDINYLNPRFTSYTWSGQISQSAEIYSDFLGDSILRVLVFSGIPRDTDSIASKSIYTYDADNQLTRSLLFGLNRDPQSGRITSFSFDPDPSLQINLKTRLKTSFQYNSYGELTQTLSRTQDNVTMYSELLTRDDLGRVISKTEMTTVEGSHTYDYSYDVAGRLVQVKKDGSVSSSYGYDSNSNRISQTTSSGTVTSTVDAQDKLTQMGSLQYAYDQNGQLVSKIEPATGKVTHYGYNGLGQLVSVTMPDGKKIRYVYDGRGQRIAKKVNGLLIESYLYDDLGRIVTLYDANTVPREVFLYHSSSHTPDAIYRLNGAPADLNVNPVYQLVLDHLGNPKLVVSVFDNSIVQELAYDEFGNVTLDTNPGLQPFGFAGCLYDSDTKLCHFGAREYDPSIGRWLSRDPIGFKGGDTNLYGYVLSDPINRVDPSGKVGIVSGIGFAACTAYNAFQSYQTYKNVRQLNKQIDDIQKATDQLQEIANNTCPNSDEAKEINNTILSNFNQIMQLNAQVAAQEASGTLLGLGVESICGGILALPF